MLGALEKRAKEVRKMKRYLSAVLTAALVLFTTSCSVGGDPGGTVKVFYSLLNNAEYSKAKELYTTEARQFVDGQLMALAGGFAKWAEGVTKGGTIKEIRIISSDSRGEGATIQYELRYADGSSQTKSANLTKEGGSWRIGLIK